MVSSRGCSVSSRVQHSRSCHVIQSAVSCHLFLLSLSLSPGRRADGRICRQTSDKIKSFLCLSALECRNVRGSEVDMEGFCCITATESLLTSTLSIIQEDCGLASHGRQPTVGVGSVGHHGHPPSSLHPEDDERRFSSVCNVLNSPSRVYLWVFPEFLVAVVKGKPSPLLLYVPR